MKKTILLLFVMLSFTIAKAQSACDGFVTNVQGYGYDEDINVYFIAFISPSAGWTLSSSTFYVTFQNTGTQTYTGGVNGSGNPMIVIPVSCSNKVMNVSVTVRFESSGSTFETFCADSGSRNFAPYGICGTAGFSKASPNPAHDILNVALSDNMDTSVKTELAIYNLQGTVVHKQTVLNTRNAEVNVSGLKPGRYILKISNENTVETHNIIVSN